MVTTLNKLDNTYKFYSKKEKRNEKKKLCYYSKNASQHDKFNVLDDFIDYCDKEASKTVFLPSFKRKKISVCDSSKCGNKAQSDLNHFKNDFQSQTKINSKLIKLRKLGGSDENIYKYWDLI